MKITIKMEDYPEGFDAHGALRSMVENAQWRLETVNSISFKGGVAVVTGEARVDDQPHLSGGLIGNQHPF